MTSRVTQLLRGRLRAGIENLGVSHPSHYFWLPGSLGNTIPHSPTAFLAGHLHVSCRWRAGALASLRGTDLLPWGTCLLHIGLPGNSVPCSSTGHSNVGHPVGHHLSRLSTLISLVLLDVVSQTHLVIITLIRSSAMCRLINVTFIISSPTHLEGAPLCGDRGTFGCHRGTEMDSLPGLQSSGFRAGPWLRPLVKKKSSRETGVGGREGEESGLPVASQRNGTAVEVRRG